MPAIDKVIAWAPVAAVVAMALLALAPALLPLSGKIVRVLWIVIVLAIAAAGGLAAVKQTRRADALSDAQSATIDELNARIADLTDQLKEVRQRVNARAIERDVAVKLTEYLASQGRHRVVVSCVENDVEAFNYANQIANVLKAANWDALGPEATAIFGKAPGMGVAIYTTGPRPSEAAAILADAFTKYNIPFQRRLAPTNANPDPETIELFIGTKP